MVRSSVPSDEDEEEEEPEEVKRDAAAEEEEEVVDAAVAVVEGVEVVGDDGPPEGIMVDGIRTRAHPRLL